MTWTHRRDNLMPRQPARVSARRSAFTMVELMVAMAILAILASMILFAMSSALETAKQDRTRTEIRKLHDLIMQRWESYELRRVPSGIVTTAANRSAALMAKDRVDRIRELMRMELPDRLTDIVDPPVTLKFFPKVWNRYRILVSQGGAKAAEGEYQSAECLYMIISNMEDGERNALEFFSAREIGDKDGDGLKEIWDAWGTPIEFLRWAPGHRSKIQPTDLDLKANLVTQLPQDQFDVRGVYSTAAAPTFALVPLIVSAGGDRKFDVLLDFDMPLRYTANNNNPYVTVSNQRLGMILDVDQDNIDSSIDNISNHGVLSE
ncbi:MAG: type II secretion system protein [Pirellulales bacterium]